MGNVNEVTNNFGYFATLPYQSGKVDIKELDRRVNVLFCQIEKSIKNNKVKKHLFRRGFTYKQLISWFNCLIDRTVDHNNMNSYSSFATMLKNKIDTIGFVDPLPVLYQRYRSALLFFNKAEASKQIYSLSLLLAPYTINVAYKQNKPVDTIMLKTASSDLESLESSYIDNFFSDYKIPGTTLISGASIITQDTPSEQPPDDPSYIKVDDTTLYRVFNSWGRVDTQALSYKIRGDTKYYYIPSENTYGKPVVLSPTLIKRGNPIASVVRGQIYYTNDTSDFTISFADYLKIYSIGSFDDDEYKEWYDFGPFVFPSGRYLVFTDDYYAHFDPKYRYLFDPTNGSSIVIYNNAEGVKLETSEYIYYTSQPGIEAEQDEKVTSYSDLFPRDYLNDQLEVKLDDSLTIYRFGPYGYLILLNDNMETERLNYLLTRFGLMQNEHTFP